MIDHVSIAVSKLHESAAFYEAVLEPLGLTKLVTRDGTVGFGKQYPEFWLNLRSDISPVRPETGNHIALRARSKEAVDAFHKAALTEGGKSAGDPGPRQGQMTTYYGAFIFDLDGNKIEVVTFPR